jgi:ABC-type amino acid transport system permease subunit
MAYHIQIAQIKGNPPLDIGADVRPLATPPVRMICYKRLGTHGDVRRTGEPGEDFRHMVPQIVGAILGIIIILGAVFGILRNVTIFLIEAVRGDTNRPWFQRPALFRAAAWTATLFWLYGPYTGDNNVLHFTADQQHNTAFALYVIAAACWLWVWHVNFLNGIPQNMLHLRFGARGGTGWQWLSGRIYLVQLIIAIGVGTLFVYAPNWISAYTPNWLPGWVLPVLARVVALILIGGSAIASIYRATYLIGPGHSLNERIQYAIGEYDAQHPAQTTAAPGESPAIPADPPQ